MRASALPVLQSFEAEVEGEDDYKPSIYNYFVEKEDQVWGVNFRSSALVRLSPEQYRGVRQILDGQMPPEDSGSLQTLRSDLIKGKFLIPSTLDEIELLRAKNRASRFGDHGLTLIVAPTLRCNFACEYCYVDLNANKMKPEDRVKVGKFFANKLPENTGGGIVWTGGDPSLAMDVVEDLSLRFIEACERKHCGYRADLITNGYLLNDQMRTHLRSSQIERLQVSLDGSRDFHDASRCLPNRKPTYDTVLRNVEDSCEEFKIFLRVNIDAKNAPYIPDLFDDLEARGLSGKVWVYFAHVDDVNVNSARYHDSCLTLEEYAKVESSLVRLALQRGFPLGGRVMTKPVMTFCGANSLNYYVVDSSANLLKCYHDFGQADKLGIGRIGDDGNEIVTNPYNLLKWLGWDPFEIAECRDCKVLPLCMGGCSHKIMNSGMNIEKGCLKLRFSMDQIIEIVGESFLNNRQVSTGCSGCAATA
jgi:uncharacterized protein